MTTSRRIAIRWLVTAAVLAGAGAAAGCDGGADFSAHHLVSIRALAFEPATLSVSPGDTITWTNDDVVPHTVTGPDWDSGELAQGERFTRVVDTIGPENYACAYHPVMTGRLAWGAGGR